MFTTLKPSFTAVATAAVLVTAGIAPAFADYADANVNGDAARLAYGWTTATSNGSDVVLEGAILFAEEEKDQDATVGSFGLTVMGDAGANAWKLRAGLGARLYAGTVDVNDDDRSGGALGLGGELSLRFPQMDRLGVSGRFYYAPDILAFSDIAEIIDFAIRLEYEVLRNGSLYLGYRTFRAEDDDSARSIDLDRGVNIGIRVNF